jgi:hypothetical protein
MSTVLILHSLLRWLVLLFGVMTLVSSLRGLSGTRVYSSGDNKANLFFMITCDIQLLLGLALFFGRGWFDSLKNVGLGNHEPRFFTMEHGLMMIIAWILVHIGRVKVKKAATDAAKFKKGLAFFGVALLLIVISIPWPFREIARPLYEWFS